MSFYNYEFVGRQDAIDRFFSLRTMRSQKNILFVNAEGGVGKTRLLEEFVKRCKDLPKPWHVAAANISPIIDFYNIQNRTIDGLRRSIARRMGNEHFEKFMKLDKDLQISQNGESKARSKNVLANLRQEVEFQFFREFKLALRDAGRYSVLFFDTFEIAYNRRVGRWFLETFLTHKATNGCIIVFAGRPRRFQLPFNAFSYSLKPFTEEEAWKYFKYLGISPGKREEKILERSDGKPLIIDLITHFSAWDEGSMDTLLEGGKEEFERGLVGRYLDQTFPLSEQIQAISYLKHRYNKAIYEHFFGDDTEQTYSQIEDELKGLPFVKYRPGEHSLTLHDEFQRIIKENAGKDWQDLANDLYHSVIHDWYPRMIANTSPGPERNLLQAEQLAYIINHDKKKGVKKYKNLFKDVKEHSLFQLNDMLWGEVAEQIGKDETAFESTQEQAIWLFDNGRHDDAAFWFEQLLDPKFEEFRSDEDSLRPVLVRLGHAYLRVGERLKTANIWEKHLENARRINNLASQAVFAYNLGHVRADEGKWDEAINLYEDAIQFARQIENLEILGQAYFVMARLRARKGNMSQATQELQRGVGLIENRHSNQIRHAQALVFAGDIHRYLDDPISAMSYYNKAGRILQNLPDDWPDWKVQVLAGTGAAYTLSGQTRRVSGGDIASAFGDLRLAFDHLIESLSLARETEQFGFLPMIFDRIGEIFIELYLLRSKAQTNGYNGDVSNISLEGAPNFRLPEERIWKFRLRQPNKTFDELDTLGKAQRLFEVAVFQADEINEFHQMFDSLTQASQVAQLRGRDMDLQYFGTLANTLRGLDSPQQEALFLGFLQLLEAHLIFPKDPRRAMEQYRIAAVDVVKGGSFGHYLIQRQFYIMKRNLMTLDKEKIQDYCDVLLNAWKGNEILENFIDDLELIILTI